MKNVFVAVFSIIVALGLNIGDAEAAKRLGGGKSVGMQREAVAPKPAAPTQAAPAPNTPAPAAAPAAQPKRNWLGPIAGLAAGLGIAALLSHFGLGEGMANFLMIALLAMAAVFVFKLLFRRKAEPQSSPLQYAGAGNTGMTPPPVAPQYGSAAPAAPTAAATIPAGFDVDGFLRVAKLNFVRLQAANDAGNLEDIREFTTPEMFAEIKMDFAERKGAAQVTDVVSIEADVLEVAEEPTRYVVSVRFTGLVREDKDAAAEPIDEIWHLVKPREGKGGWLLAGIQQIQ